MLTKHFQLSEFEAGSRGGPVDGLVARELYALCVAVLEPLRLHLGSPVRITSGHRPGDPGQHGKGRAADIALASMQDRARAWWFLVMLAKSGVVDQLIIYRKSTHLHVSVAGPVPSRRSILVADDRADRTSYEAWSGSLAQLSAARLTRA